MLINIFNKFHIDIYFQYILIHPEIVSTLYSTMKGTEAGRLTILSTASETA